MLDCRAAAASQNNCVLVVWVCVLAGEATLRLSQFLSPDRYTCEFYVTFKITSSPIFRLTDTCLILQNILD